MSAVARESLRLPPDPPDKILGCRSRDARVLESAQVQKPASILTETQMRDLERANTRAALERCRGKLYGKDGAAHLLGLNPTTLASRLLKL